jgi:signal peptidase
MGIFKKILKILLNIILIFLILVGIVIGVSLLPIKNNIEILSVMSGSMEPAIHVGSVVVVKPIAEYKVGDIITFKAYDKNSKSKDKSVNITHRIYEVGESDGQVTFIVKGDANNAPDGGKVYKGQVVGKELFSVPWLGYLLVYIKTLPGLILLIVIPATIIVYEEVRKIHRETKMIIEKRRAKNKSKKTGKKTSKKTSKKTKRQDKAK